MSLSEGVLVLGGYVNALGVVRELAASHIPVEVVTWERFAIAQYSRAVSAHHRLADSADLVGLLENLGAGHREWLLIPTNDHALVELAKHRESLRAWYRSLVPEWEITRGLIDKTAATDAAKAVGISVPTVFGPAVTGGIDQMGLRFPLLVKPDRSHLFQERFGKKLFVVRDRPELAEAVETTIAAGLDAQLIEYVPGPEERVVVFSALVGAEGEPSEEFCFRKPRHAPPRFGVASMAEPCTCPELVEPSRALLARLSWRGPAGIEYKFDERDGCYRFIEINGRSVLSNSLARRAGFPFATGQWSLARGGTWKPQPNGWKGRWIHLHADLLTQVVGRGQSKPSWKAFRRSYSGPKIFGVWATRDPRPFAVQWTRSLADLARLPFRSAERRALRGRVEPPSGL
jgi:predicted ATP-grasp superfamily ATP-dependent carboligase